MVKVRILSFNDAIGRGVVVYCKVMQGTPTGRMRVTLPVGDEVKQYQIHYSGRPHFGAADLIFTIPARKKSEQLQVMDTLKEDPDIWLEVLPPSESGESRNHPRTID
jgi:hypothetical protein